MMWKIIPTSFNSVKEVAPDKNFTKFLRCDPWRTVCVHVNPSTESNSLVKPSMNFRYSQYRTKTESIYYYDLSFTLTRRACSYPVAFLAYTLLKRITSPSSASSPHVLGLIVDNLHVFTSLRALKTSSGRPSVPSLNSLCQG
jgi:hypothetical protein